MDCIQSTTNCRGAERMASETTIQRYYLYSEKASDISRSIGFAGLGVIWIFQQDYEGKPIISPELVRAGIFIVIGLGIDLIHYVSKTFYWAYRAYADTESQPEKDQKLGMTTIGFLLGKFASMLYAYWCLTHYLSTHIYYLTHINT